MTWGPANHKHLYSNTALFSAHPVTHMNRLKTYFFVGWSDKKLTARTSDRSKDQVKQYKKVMILSQKKKKKTEVKELKKLYIMYI